MTEQAKLTREKIGEIFDEEYKRLFADELMHNTTRDVAIETALRCIALRVLDAPASAEPVAWQDVHDRTNLYYRKPVQGDVRPLYAAPPADSVTVPTRVSGLRLCPVCKVVPGSLYECARNPCALAAAPKEK